MNNIINTQKGSVWAGVLVAVLAIAFTVWYVFFKAESKPVPEAPTPIATTTLAATSDASSSESEIAKAIIESPYRVIKMYTNDTYKNVIYVATERSTTQCGSSSNPTRCTDDFNCGSRYTSPTCFFFTEPKYEVGSNPKTEFLGSLQSAGALDLDSLEMNDNRYLYFSTFEGDAGSGFNADYQLDLQTKKFKLLKKTEFHAEM